jgi:hypothetical protein
MNLLKLSLNPLSFMIAAALASGGCGHQANPAALTAAKAESTTSAEPSILDVKFAALTIKGEAASKEVNYIDMELPISNKSDAALDGQVLSFIFPVDEPEHLVSFLRTSFSLDAGAEKNIKPMMSLVRPRSVKNGKPKLYKVKIVVTVQDKEVAQSEKEFEVKF